MMKTKDFFTCFIILAVLFSGCQKASQYRDVIYFTGTEASPETKFTIDDPASIGVSITSSTKVENDVEVVIQLRPELVATFNEMNGKSYKFLPEGSYSLSTNSVVIESGTNVSESATFSVTSLDQFTEGTIYCVPISIISVEGNLEILEASQTIFLIINRTIITQAASLSPNYFTVPSFQSNPSLSSISNLTLECRVYVNQFQSANPYISSVMGIEENFLLRFGDVSVAKNQLQLAGGLINGHKYPVTTNTFFSTGKWYHVAVVYNGTSMSLYVDGLLDSYTNAETGGVDLTDDYMGGFHIGYSSNGRLLSGSVSEARVWTRALTASEMQNNLCYVDPTSNGLVAYWRFNDADVDGNVTDLTGHGNKAVANRAIIWVPGVRCPE